MARVKSGDVIRIPTPSGDVDALVVETGARRGLMTLLAPCPATGKASEVLSTDEPRYILVTATQYASPRGWKTVGKLEVDVDLSLLTEFVDYKTLMRNGQPVRPVTGMEECVLYLDKCTWFDTGTAQMFEQLLFTRELNHASGRLDERSRHTMERFRASLQSQGPSPPVLPSLDRHFDEPLLAPITVVFRPAISVTERHELEDTLMERVGGEFGADVVGSGQAVDGSEGFIEFECERAEEFAAALRDFLGEGVEVSVGEALAD